MKLKYILPVLTLGLMLTGCKKSQKIEDQLEAQMSVDDVVNENLNGDQRSQEQHITDSVNIDGKLYTYEIHRVSSDSLPTVKSEYSQNATFYDNRASLKVMQGNKVVYSKTFTKNSFQNLVDAEMMKKSILEGLVFDRVIKGGLQFAVAVGYPQDEDMYVPIIIKVMTNGSVSIEKDPLSDTASEADIDPKEATSANEDEGV